MVDRRAIVLLLGVSATACAHVTVRNNLQPLVTSLHAAVSLKITDDPLRKAVSEYVNALDSLRIINLETTLEQRRSRDWYVTGALFLSAAAVGIAATNMEEGDKAALTGIAAAAGGLLTALNAKFRHDEDAALSEVCAKLAERELIAFEVPADLTTFNSQRATFAKVWKEAECPAAQTRLGL